MSSIMHVLVSPIVEVDATKELQARGWGAQRRALPSGERGVRVKLLALPSACRSHHIQLIEKMS